MPKKITKEDNKELIPLSFDLMFKKVFVDDTDKSSLLCLLDYVLDIKVKDVTILNSEIIASSYYDKKTTVDLIVKLEDDTVIGIQMNTGDGTFVIIRNLFYLTKIMSKDLDSSDTYLNLHKHIQVNFDIRGKHTKPIMHYYLLDEETLERLTDKIEIIRIDVNYFKELCYNNDISQLDLKERLIGLVGADSKEKAETITRGDVKTIIDDWMDYYNNERYQWELAKLAPSEYYEYIVTGIYPIKSGLIKNPSSNN